MGAIFETNHQVIVSGLPTGRPGFDSRQERNFSLRHRLQIGCGAHPVAGIHMMQDALSMGLKRLGWEADHSSTCSAEFKNAWSYTSTTIHFHDVLGSTRYVFTARYFVKQRYKFICTHFTTTKTFTDLQLASFNLYMFVWHSVVCVEHCYISLHKVRQTFLLSVLFRPENTEHLWQLKSFYVPCRLRVLDWYGFRFSISSWNMLKSAAMSDSVVLSVAQTVMEFERNGRV
jgi:hypothetical protein